MAEQYSWLDASGKGYSAGQYGGEAGKLREWSRNTVADGKWLNKETIEPFSGRDQYLLDSLNQTYDECSAFSGDLQNQINVIEARADVIDVVGSYHEFVDKYSANFDPTEDPTISDKDVVKILNDETSAHSQTYYRWFSATEPTTGYWEGVGSLEPYYSNAELVPNEFGLENTDDTRNYRIIADNDRYIQLVPNGHTGTIGLTDNFIESASQCYTALTSHSASWDETSATLNGNSGKWEQAYTALTSNSASWDETSATLRDNSGKWEQSYTALTSTSGGWNNTSAWVYNNSANIVDASATLYNNSANWQATYSAVSSNSATWNETAYVPLSAQECLIGSGNTVISPSQNNVVFIQGRDNSANSLHSFAQGQDNIVENVNSFAQGYANHTYGENTFAQGSEVSASKYSIAQGYKTSAYFDSFAAGSASTASIVSFAQGFKNSTYNLSFAQGQDNTGKNTSLTQGWQNSASDCSIAQGYDNRANNNSIAQGSENTANNYSIAQGFRANATDYSIAQGFRANATDYSIAQGYTVNSEDHSFGQGENNTATYTAFTQGNTNTASMDAFSQGISNTAAQEAFTQGSGNNAEINSFAQGKANNASHTAFAQGLENTAIGYSFAQGYKNDANSVNETLGMSFAQGYANTADVISFAQGRDNHADNRSFAQGSANTAIEIGFAHGVRNHADGGFANGTDNTALGTGSLAIGVNNYAGNYAQALGRGVKINGSTNAPLRGGMAIGTFNKTSANVAFVIGNGTNESNRSDLYWIDYDGNVSAKGNISATNFYINGNSIDSIVSAKFSAYNGSNTLLTAYPISSFGLYANTAKYITVSTTNNNRLDFSVADTLINSASSGYQAKQWINTNGDGIIGVSSTVYNNSAAWGETAYVPLSAIECKIGNANSANEISFAQGQGACAKTISFAQGQGTRAQTISFAQGLTSVAQEYSFAQGLTNSSNRSSFAQGVSNIANDYSIAQGVSSTALNYSQAFGAGTVITNTGMAIGWYNKTSADVAFVIGNGHDDTRRSDLYWIDHDGNVSAKGNISATNFYINGTPLSDLTYTMLYGQGSSPQPTKFNISSLNVTNYRSNQNIDFISLNVTASNGSNASFALWPDDTTKTGTPVSNTLIPIIDTMQNRNQKKYMKVSDLNIGNYVSAATIEGVQQKITIATAHEVDDFTQDGIIYLVF